MKATSWHPVKLGSKLPPNLHMINGGTLLPEPETPKKNKNVSGKKHSQNNMNHDITLTVDIYGVFLGLPFLPPLFWHIGRLSLTSPNSSSKWSWSSASVVPTEATHHYFETSKTLRFTVRKLVRNGIISYHICIIYTCLTCLSFILGPKKPS